MTPMTRNQDPLDTETLDLFLVLHEHLDSPALEQVIIHDMDHLKQVVRSLRGALASHDAEAARPDAHDLTGLAATYGLHELSYLADEIGGVCRGRGEVGFDRLSARLDEVSAGALDALGKALPERTGLKLRLLP